jgi:hypothetical protein
VGPLIPYAVAPTAKAGCTRARTGEKTSGEETSTLSNLLTNPCLSLGFAVSFPLAISHLQYADVRTVNVHEGLHWKTSPKPSEMTVAA